MKEIKMATTKKVVTTVTTVLPAPKPMAAPKKVAKVTAPKAVIKPVAPKATPKAPAPRRRPVAPATTTVVHSSSPWPYVAGIVLFLALCIGSLLALSMFKDGILSLIQPPSAVAQSLPTPVGSSAPQTPNTPALVTGCPTTAEVKTATGVDVQRIGTEACAFVWRGTPPATISATCPLGFVCTFDVVNDIVVVHTGVGQSAQIRAGTWRWMGSYPGEDSCTLFRKEVAFAASENPTFEVRFQASQDGSGSPVGPQFCQ